MMNIHMNMMTLTEIDFIFLVIVHLYQLRTARGGGWVFSPTVSSRLFE